MRDSPILVTGGAGFIGSALVRHLVLARGLRVVTLDALTYAGSRESLERALDHPAHVFERADTADASAVASILARHQPRAVLHLAAESHVDRSIDGPAAFVRTNILGTFALLEQSLAYWRGLEGERREAFRFVHVSTDEVFGALGASGRFTAESPHRPNSPYAASKSAADQLVRAWHHTYRFPAITTNCCNNYGPYQFPEKLIPLVIRKAARGEAIPVYGAGDQVRDWLHVDDHVAALVAALERGVSGETYVVGADAERRNIDVVRAICAEVDRARPSADGRAREHLITHVADRPGHDFRYAIDASATRRALGWSPVTPFERGLAATVRWYLEHEEWCARVLRGGHDGERLGLGGFEAGA